MPESSRYSHTFRIQEILILDTIYNGEVNYENVSLNQLRVTTRDRSSTFKRPVEKIVERTPNAAAGILTRQNTINRLSPIYINNRLLHTSVAVGFARRLCIFSTIVKFQVRVNFTPVSIHSFNKMILLLWLSMQRMRQSSRSDNRSEKLRLWNYFYIVNYV